MIYKDKNGLYKMSCGIQKVYLNKTEIAFYEMQQKTNNETKGKKRIFDPFVGYIEKQGC